MFEKNKSPEPVSLNEVQEIIPEEY